MEDAGVHVGDDLSTGGTPSSSMSSDGLRKLASQHVGLLVAAGVTCLIALRVLSESGYNVVTARDVLAVAATSVIPTALVLAVLPQVVIFVLFFAGDWLLRRGDRFTACVELVGLLAVASPFIPSGFLFGIAAALVAVQILRTRVARSWDRLSDEERESRRRASAAWPGYRRWVSTAMPLLLFVLSGAGAWLPTEVLRTDDGDELVGYVLGERQGWLHLLGTEERGVTQVRSSAVTDRFLCGDRSSGVGRWLSTPLPQLLGRGHDPDYPDCDDFGD